MPVDTHIIGNDNTTAEVTKDGALRVINREFNLVKKQVLDSTAVFSFYPPLSGQQFVIAGIIMNAARSVTNECLITVFEADTVDGASTKDIVAIDLAKSVTTPLLGVNILVNSGKYINATTDDPTCNVTVVGYYVRV